jgi:uncharacterized protein YndB with AHSA1/START domain
MTRLSTPYRFDSVWHLQAPRRRVYAALADIEGYLRWWTQVRAISHIDADSARVKIRSLLPYTLDLVLTRAAQDEAGGILRVDIEGDLQGWCAWELSDEKAGTRAGFSQEVVVMAPLLGRAPSALRPLLRANHTHLMRSGESGLSQHLDSLPS